MKSPLIDLRVVTLAALTLAAIGCAAPAYDGAGLDGSESSEDDDDGEHDGTDFGMGFEGEEDEAALLPSARRASVSRAACPTSGRLSQGFSSAHDGIDLANARGTAIFAVAAGTVTASGPANGYGQWIRIKHDDGSMTEYGHMYQRLVSVGARVSAGQRIALMGSEGRSTGPHLHLRTYRSANSTGSGRGMNPVDYLRARGVSVPCTPGVATSPVGAVERDSAPAGSITVSVWQTANLRAAPTTASAVVGAVQEDTTYPASCWKAGETVQSDGYTNHRWVKVTADGVTGFVSGIFLRGDETGGVTKVCP